MEQEWESNSNSNVWFISRIDTDTGIGINMFGQSLKWNAI